MGRKSEFTHPLFEPLDRFGVNTNLRVIPSAGETETQKRPPPGMDGKKRYWTKEAKAARPEGRPPVRD